MAASAKKTGPLWSAWGIPEPTPEFRFCGDRKWRTDFAWTDERLALEVEGGLWVKGRHNRPKSMIDEMSKYNRLAMIGWRLLRCTPQQLESGEIMGTIREALGL